MEVSLSKREILDERERIPVRSRTPEVWKGGALLTLLNIPIAHLYCTSLHCACTIISMSLLVISQGRIERGGGALLTLLNILAHIFCTSLPCVH